MVNKKFGAFYSGLLAHNSIIGPPLESHSQSNNATTALLLEGLRGHQEVVVWPMASQSIILTTLVVDTLSYAAQQLIF